MDIVTEFKFVFEIEAFGVKYVGETISHAFVIKTCPFAMRLLLKADSQIKTVEFTDVILLKLLFAFEPTLIKFPTA